MPRAERTQSNMTTDQDALLQASRRIDWRFLLPDPELGDAAHIGRHDAVLVAALRTFTDSLTILDGLPEAPDEANQFPLVVASNPSHGELDRAASLTRSGGFLYVEVDKRRSRADGPHRIPGDRFPRGVRGLLAAMRNLELTEPRAYWHWPDFEACLEMTPLHDRKAARCALKRRGSGARARWKTRIARVLLETGFLATIVPCFSIISRRCS
jgi:hypothetical protein